MDTGATVFGRKKRSHWLTHLKYKWKKSKSDENSVGGFIFGGLQALVMPKGARMWTIARTSTQMGLMFGTLVAVGFVIRS